MGKSGIAGCNGCIFFWPNLLALVFIILKLVGVITWSWWWVLSPLFVEVGSLVGIVLLVVGLYVYDAYMTKNDQAYRYRKITSAYLGMLGKK